MKFSSFFSLCGLVGSSLLFSSCGSGETHYYDLEPVMRATPSMTASSLSGLNVIEIRTPSISARLDRDSIVKGSQNYRLNIEENAAWASPPAEMVGHILVEDLSQRLPGKIIFSQNDSVGVSPQICLELSLTHFELDRSGHAVIEGILSLHQPGAIAGKERAVSVHWLSPEKVQGGMASFVAALSQGVGAISDQAVELLQTPVMQK